MYNILDPKQTNELLLIRHGWLSPEYELTDNTTSYGRLAYCGISRRTAIARSATGNWVFKNGDIFSRSIIITDETGEFIGETKRELFSNRTTLTLKTGFTADFYKPFPLSRERIWESNGYGTILRIKSYPFLFRDNISLERTMVQPAIIPLLVFLGTHLTILRRRKRAAH